MDKSETVEMALAGSGGEKAGIMDDLCVSGMNDLVDRWLLTVMKILEEEDSGGNIKSSVLDL